jgi:hypothetical protein
MEYGFKGSFGVDGLSVGISQAKIQAAQTSGNDDLTSTHYGGLYLKYYRIICVFRLSAHPYFWSPGRNW